MESILREKLESIIRSAILTERYCLQTMINKHKNIVCYGIGQTFNNIFIERGIKDKCHVNYLADISKEKQGKQFFGINVIEPSAIKELEKPIVIICIDKSDEVKELLQSWNIPFVGYGELILELQRGQEVTKEEFRKNTIIETYNYLSDMPSRELFVEIMAKRLAPELSKYTWGQLVVSPLAYFNMKYFPVGKDECFVDCGAYTGDSLLELLDITETIDSAYCFEMAKVNYDLLLKNTGELDNCKVYCYNLGVYSERKYITYGNENTSGGVSFSIFKDSNTQKALADTLDNVLENKKVTLIKMDIEGAELDALKGAENIIKTQHPKLAVCLYHRIDDFWRIPVYIKSINANYKFGIMHHSHNELDTVLYAWIQDEQ